MRAQVVLFDGFDTLDAIRIRTEPVTAEGPREVPVLKGARTTVATVCEGTAWRAA